MDLRREEQRLSFCRDTVIPIVRETARENIGRTYDVTSKGHGNFVTSIDQKIEGELKRRLAEALPDAVFLAEESGEDAGRKARYKWIIDPIDGTSNFIFGFPYAVSVALQEVKSGRTLLGVVFVPETDTVYYAAWKKGSYRAAGGLTEPLHVKRFQENEGIVIFGMPYDRTKSDKILAIAGEYYRTSSDLKRIGPASLDICRVASGAAKTYVELDLKEWDVAAGILILQEAGGTYEKRDDLMIFSSGK